MQTASSQGEFCTDSSCLQLERSGEHSRYRVHVAYLMYSIGSLHPITPFHPSLCLFAPFHPPIAHFSSFPKSSSETAHALHTLHSVQLAAYENPRGLLQGHGGGTNSWVTTGSLRACVSVWAKTRPFVHRSCVQFLYRTRVQFTHALQALQEEFIQISTPDNM